jgi:hypothetical protein
MGNKIGVEKVSGQTYFADWEHGTNPPPRYVNAGLELYIDGVTYYPKLIEIVPIYYDRYHVVFRFGKDIFSAYVEVFFNEC